MYILITSGSIFVALWFVSGYLAGKIMRNEWKKIHSVWTLTDERYNRHGLFLGLISLFVTWICKRMWKDDSCILCTQGFVVKCKERSAENVKSWF